MSFADPRLRGAVCAGALVCASFASASCELLFQPIEASATDDAGADGAQGQDARGSANGRPPSCVDAPGASRCGPAGNGDCCATGVVPATASFKRSYDAETYADGSHAATVGAVRLDVYEVTVGRFRKFVEAYPGSKPRAGAGRSKEPLDPGWKDDPKMPASSNDMAQRLVSCSAPTWTVDNSGDARPINCVLWFEADAFCIWDGGRLPTEAEWNVAAAGGTDQRVFPWSVPARPGLVAAHDAVYQTGAPASVGSKSPDGDGRWQHADLAGNVAEWILDWYNPQYRDPCDDCAELGTQLSTRVVRGGAYGDPAAGIHASARSNRDPLNRYDDVGFRCARDP